MTNIKALDTIAFALVIIGGLNWGLVGVLNIDLVVKIFGEATAMSQVVYTLIGLSALYLAVNYKKVCKK